MKALLNFQPVAHSKFHVLRFDVGVSQVAVMTGHLQGGMAQHLLQGEWISAVPEEQHATRMAQFVGITSLKSGLFPVTPYLGFYAVKRDLFPVFRKPESLRANTLRPVF